MGNIYVTLNDQITNKIEWYDQYENKNIYIKNQNQNFKCKKSK